jgi:DNA-binding NtrC family response regulator
MGSVTTLRHTDSTDSFPFPVARYSETISPFRVAVVTSDVAIQASMVELLQECSLKPELASGIAELKSICAGAPPIACLCGFELADGSFRDAVEWLDAQPVEIPVIMVSPPSVGKMPGCFVDSVKAGALATICYPYRLNDVQIMLWSAIQSQRQLL